MSNEKQSGGKDEQSKQRGGSGNFADDPQRASEAGKKGGQHSHGGTGQASQSGSGRSQQGSVKSDSDDDMNESDKSSSGSTGKR